MRALQAQAKAWAGILPGARYTITRNTLNSMADVDADELPRIKRARWINIGQGPDWKDKHGIYTGMVELTKYTIQVYNNCAHHARMKCTIQC